MTGYALLLRHYKKLHKTKVALLRRNHKGEACKWGGDKAKALSAVQVLRKARVVGSLIELLVRRIKMYHRCSLEPHNHVQATAAILESYKVDDEKEVDRLCEGRMCGSSTPMAHQFVQGMAALGAVTNEDLFAEADGVVHRYFGDGDVAERFPMQDATMLRAAGLFLARRREPRRRRRAAKTSC